MSVYRLRCIGFILLLSGCGSGDGIKTADVAGTITMDGKPLAGVEVFFSTDKFEGYGKTDENGKYRLINGAAVGANKIFMKKFDVGGGGLPGMDTSIPGMDEKQMAAMQAAQSSRGGKSKSNASMIPPEYSDPKTTKLTFPVPDGGSESADFRLSAK